VPVTKLNELYRQKEDSYIINLATEINKGIIDEDFTLKRSDYNFIETNKEQIEYMISELCKKALEKGYNYNQVQVLVPMYKGLNGINNLNNKLQDIFNPKSKNKDEYIHNDTIFREDLQVKLC
jgi:exodeoxyribonuclease V alpha subunit